MILAGGPCFKCGVNTWTSCKHREAYAKQPKHTESKPTMRIAGGGSYKISRFENNADKIRRVLA